MQQSKKELLLEILRFLIVGGFATLCDYAVFYGCKALFVRNNENAWLLALATALGFLTGLFVNWFLQKFVFKYLDKEDTSSKVKFLKFFILSLAGLGITELGILLAKPLYETLYWDILFLKHIDVWQLFFKCLMTGIVLVINYIGRKIWVFKKTSAQN